MIDLYQMMMQAQGGYAVDNLARQFGLSREQAEAAVSALLPAFSTSLKRNTDQPGDLSAFLNALGSGRHMDYYENAMAAFTPQAMMEGNGILGHLFGSPEVSRAVAAQAAATTGLGQAILKQMLPVIASMIMGGLFKNMGGAGGQGGFLGTLIENMLKGGLAGMGGSAPQTRRAGADNPFGDLLEQMMGGGARQGGGAGRSAAPDNPFGDMLDQMFGGGARQGGGSGQRSGGAPDNPFGDILDQMFGGGARQQGGGGQRQGGAPDNPLGDIFDQMFGGGQRRAEAPAPEAEPEAPSSPRGKDIFGEMFEAGRQVQKDYQKNIDDIFDAYLEGMRRR